MHILQLSTAMPQSKYSTEALLEVFPCPILEGVRENTLNLGVSTRHLINHADMSSRSEAILNEESLVDLCVEACEKAVENAGISVGSIGHFIVAYDVNPILCPGLSQLLVRKLGFSPYVNHVNVQGMACTAFTKALELAQNHLAAHPRDYVLICVSGVNSFLFYNQVRGMKDLMEIGKINSLKPESKKQAELRKWIAAMEFFLFGDGVASIVVANDGGSGLSVGKVVEITNLEDRDYLAGYARLAALNEPFKFGLYSHLDRKIPEFGVRYLSIVLERLFGEDVGGSLKAARKLAVHTGSEKILRKISEHYRVEPEKLEESFEVLREYGNLAGASLPFILERMVSKGKLVEGDTVLALGYGWGFSASACSLKLDRGKA
jgi:predicted naringenin-chalcone synthase